MSARFTHRQAFLQLTGLLVLSIAMIGIVTNVTSIQTWLSQALGEEADLVIDAQTVTGPLTTPWRSIAQGGESATYTFGPASTRLHKLQPQYIRLDHIFDMYTSVTVNPNGSLNLNFTQLDLLLQEIKNATATPFISLSYMPPAISTGDVTDNPRDWRLWQDLVRQTIEHISGTNNLNIPDVYYEIWNEPDLFGNFKTYGEKNYLTLYEQTALAAKSTTQTQPFFIGGPATTNLYNNWVTTLVDLANTRNLPLDFYSWHLYSNDVDSYAESLKKYYSLLNGIEGNTLFPEPIISEWGITPQVHKDYDSDISAAHLVSVSSVLSAANITKAFVFEFQDGLDPQNQPLWGRWGLVTHPNFNSQPKPRYDALTFLNRLAPHKLAVTGEGTWVKAIAAKALDNTLTAVLTNYDQRDAHTEITPVTFQNLIPGNYAFTHEYLGRPPTTTTLTTPSSTYSTTLSLPPNTIIYLELKPSETVR